MRHEAASGSGTSPREPEVIAALRRCHDPCCKEKEISVVDMGLVERVRIDGDRVDVDLVLTSGWCPFSMHLLTMVEEEVGAIEGVGEVQVNITWDRVWTPERLSAEASAKLRLPMEQLLPLREARVRREADERANRERAKREPRTNERDETGESR